MGPAEAPGHRLGLGALAGAGASHHNHHKRFVARNRVPERELVVVPRPRSAPGSLARGDLRVGRPEPVHLPAHLSALTFVKRHQRLQAGVVQSVGHPVHEAPRQVRVALSVQIHGQEGHVVRYVEVPKLLIELDAVENGDALVREVDVLQPQVAMAFHDEAPRPAPVQEGGVLIVKPIGVEPERLVGGTGEQGADVALRLLKILLGNGAEPSDATGLRDLWRRRAGLVECTERAHHAVDV